MLEFQASGAEDVVEGDRPVLFFGVVDSDAVIADGGVCYCRRGSEYPDDVGGGVLLADDAGGFLGHLGGVWVFLLGFGVWFLRLRRRVVDGM